MYLVPLFNFPFAEWKIEIGFVFSHGNMDKTTRKLWEKERRNFLYSSMSLPHCHKMSFHLHEYEEQKSSRIWNFLCHILKYLFLSHSPCHNFTFIFIHISSLLIFFHAYVSLCTWIIHISPLYLHVSLFKPGIRLIFMALWRQWHTHTDTANSIFTEKRFELSDSDTCNNEILNALSCSHMQTWVQKIIS